MFGTFTELVKLANRRAKEKALLKEVRAQRERRLDAKAAGIAAKQAYDALRAEHKEG